MKTLTIKSGSEEGFFRRGRKLARQVERVAPFPKSAWYVAG